MISLGGIPNKVQTAAILPGTIGVDGTKANDLWQRCSVPGVNLV